MPSCKISLKNTRPKPKSYPRQLVTWGDHIKRKRFDLGLFQKDVARIFRVDKNTVRNWEGNRTSPRLVYLPRMISFLGYAPYFGPCCTLGEKIVRSRKYLGLSQESLARQLGIDPGTLRRWESRECDLKTVRVKEMNYLSGWYKAHYSEPKRVFDVI